MRVTSDDKLTIATALAADAWNSFNNGYYHAALHSMRLAEHFAKTGGYAKLARSYAESIVRTMAPEVERMTHQEEQAAARRMFHDAMEEMQDTSCHFA